MKKILTALLVVFGLGFVSAGPVRGNTIQPDEVLIIGNSRVPESMELANFYARQRQIPSRNILMLVLPNREEINRDQYNQLLARPVREFITRQKLEGKIRVLVTMYGVPLKVGAASPNLEQRRIAEEVKRNYFAVFAELEERYREAEKMAGVTTTQPTTLPGRQDIDRFTQEIPRIGQKIENLYKPIVAEIQSIKDPVRQNVRANQFGKIRLALEGQSAFLRAIMARNPEQGKKLAEVLKQKEHEFLSLQGAAPERRDREKLFTLAREIGGIVLQLKTMREDYVQLVQKESGSAVDSELSLVLWRDYPLAGRVPNGLNPRLAENPMIANKGPIVMVSRLDGPTPETVERIIRDSVETEKKGLFGKTYIDARGIRDQKGFYEYDEDLRTLGRKLHHDTQMPVTMDDRPELFPPDTCPNAALYCGWYSLRNYIPAFTFLPGSVGYHIASFEATTLKHPNVNQWVKRMLENGIAATVGAVDEPYLDAFPLPTEFFGLLLTGQYSLVEVYYRTKRYNSWRMMLIGDPLYRPFAPNAQLTENEVQLQPLGLLLVN